MKKCMWKLREVLTCCQTGCLYTQLHLAICCPIKHPSIAMGTIWHVRDVTIHETDSDSTSHWKLNSHYGLNRTTWTDIQNRKVRRKAVPLLPCGRQRGEIVTSYSCLILTLDGNEWSALRPGSALPPGERNPPSTHWTGGWESLSAGLETGYRKSISSAGNETPVTQSSSL
jgi:hypothetical protein